MNPARAGRRRRILTGVVLVIGGPVLGAAALVLGTVTTWVVTLALLAGWAALAYRMIHRSGTRRWTAAIGAAVAVAWTLIAPWILLIVALSAGPGFQGY